VSKGLTSHSTHYGSFVGEVFLVMGCLGVMFEGNLCWVWQRHKKETQQPANPKVQSQAHKCTRLTDVCRYHNLNAHCILCLYRGRWHKKTLNDITKKLHCHSQKTKTCKLVSDAFHTIPTCLHSAQGAYAATVGDPDHTRPALQQNISSYLRPLWGQC